MVTAGGSFFFENNCRGILQHTHKKTYNVEGLLGELLGIMGQLANEKNLLQNHV
jgi:hypothetical protein